MPNILNAFDSFDDEMRLSIDDMVRRKYAVLPRPLYDYLNERFITRIAANQLQGVTLPGVSPATSRPSHDQQTPAQNTGHPSSNESSATTQIRHDVSPSALSAVQQPGSTGVQPSSIFSGAVGQQSRVICTAEYLNKAVLGGQNFVALKHPTQANVYLKLPFEVF